MKTPKEFYVVVDKEGRFWAGQGFFTTRPWQAKFYSVREQAEKTAKRKAFGELKVVKARISVEMENTDERQRKTKRCAAHSCR